MSPQLQVMLWGFAVIAPFALNMGMRTRPDAVGLSGMLVLIWALGRMLWSLIGPPACMAVNPVIDGIAGAVAFSAWVTRPKLWKLILTGLYVGQLALAFDFWLAWPESANLWRYVAFNNALFVGELLCCAYPGGRDVVAYLALRRLSRRTRLVHHGGP